mgnify:CR=1 FL=1
MTDEQRNTAQDILDNLLRDAYSRGFADATNDQKDIGELEDQNRKLIGVLKSLDEELESLPIRKGDVAFITAEMVSYYRTLIKNGIGETDEGDNQ